MLKRVLLISPLPDLDPPCGDITYTQNLLRNPPKGYVYETYSDALKAGRLIELGRRRRFFKEPILTILNKIINVLRKRKLIFWEPYRFFSIVGHYDLVHLHVFNARFISLNCPLVISAGAPQRDVYLDRRNYTLARVKRMEVCEKILARLFRMNCNSYWMPQVSKALVYTTYFRDYLINRSFVAANRVSVVPIMEVSKKEPLMFRRPTKIGFVARDFAEKGGPVVLSAFEIVRKTRPDVSLFVVGSDSVEWREKALAAGAEWLGLVPRQTLVQEIMPSFDIFAYPTPHDCFSYVVLEAMSCGVAIATSDYVSMPEAVDYGKAGLISPVGSSADLARNILTLLDPDTNWHFRQAARRRFEEYFACEVVGPQIRAIYEELIETAVKSS